MFNVNQKIPVSQSLNQLVDRKIDDASLMSGRQYPCKVVGVTGSVVTVAFDVTLPNQNLPQITVPVFGPEYIRYPIQVGDLGFLVSADVSIAKISGLGGGTASPDDTNWGNMSQLVFFPIGNKNWFSVDGNVLFMYGPNGVELTTSNRDCTLVLSSTGISINLNGGNLTVNNGNVTINGNVTTNGTLTNNGTNVGSTHVHGGVQAGGSNTSTPH
jgi:hypothetical protein